MGTNAETNEPSELLVLARQLYARRASGVVVPYNMLDPQHVEGQCHQNAGVWARDNPGWKAAHGWLVFDHETTSFGLLPLVQFNPHSVVEDGNGVRVDPTPSRASQRYPFLDHEGAVEDFSALGKAFRCSASITTPWMTTSA